MERNDLASKYVDNVETRVCDRGLSQRSRAFLVVPLVPAGSSGRSRKLRIGDTTTSLVRQRDWNLASIGSIVSSRENSPPSTFLPPIDVSSGDVSSIACADP